MIGKDDKADELLSSSLATEETPLALLTRADRRPIDETDQKLAELTKALQIDPDFVPALLSRGNALWMEYQFKQALADVNKAIQLQPDALQAYDIKTKILIDTDRKKEAVAVPQQAVAANPDNPGAYMLAAYLYDRLGMPKEAKAMRDKQLALPVQSADALLYRSTLRAPDDVAGRETDVEAALALDPNSVRALAAKAQLQGDRGDWIGAAATLAHARERERNDPMLATMHGIALAKAGQEQDAAVEFDAARQLAKTALDLNNICHQKATSGVALERAVEECNASLELAPGAPSTLDSRGLAYLRLGRIEDAKADFSIAIEKIPTAPNPLYGRAIVRALAGDLKGAREDSTAALRISPEMEKTFRKWGIEIPPAIAVKPGA
jgi:tetratricopeptide (TPR) repeat protein